ncbi:AraC family transcriptional regulator [Paenibacillus sp. N4]|uniref:AraC family transcriptional regulator n=1 Tax=Paenibacillus vietnamensis TaxID=2590547 RepID=UPI001CD09D84|nr:AraC family transcriptional regulator [Paenibacillus vietnamensis]MCA0756937.1 AraC family transcriptional regulator [Paenibacillus vietnamensis]
MPASRTVNNGKLYSRLLFTITLCIVLTLFVSSLFYFFTYSRIDLKKAYQSDLRNLTQTSKEVISMTESAQSVSFQIYRTFTISKLMFYTEPNIYDVTAAMNELNNYLNSMPFIESIYVYNSKNDLFYTASRQGQGGTLNRAELADKGILDILENFQQYKPFTPIPRTYLIDQLSGEEKTKAYTYLGYDAIGKNQTINSAVIINVSAAWINKDIGVSSSDAAGKSYILDNQDRLLSGDTLEAKTLGVEDSTLLTDRIKNQPSGYIVADFEGRKSLISFTSPDSLEWQYVRITPYDKVTAAVSSIRNMTLLIAASIMIAGLFISWLLSRMLYKPIHQIVDKMNMLESEKRNSSYTIRQNTLRSLIQGTKALQTDEQVHKLAQSGITFTFGAGYRVVMIKIDRFAELKETRGADIPVYKFAIMNISGEIGLEHYRVETVDMEDDCIVMLLGRLEGTPADDDELLRSVLGQIRQSTMDFLKIGISVTYSTESDQPQQLPALYKMVHEASLHRLFLGLGCLINAQDIMDLKSKEYVFPVDKERKLTDALMTSKTDEAKRLFAEIVHETAGYPIQVVQLAISHLTMSVNSILFTIQKNNNLDVEAGIGVPIPAPDKFETIGELKDVFFSLFEDIQAKLSMKRNNKQEELVRKINELVDKEYANPSFGLNWIADELGMSSIYVSRIYKQQTLNAIVDVINNVRLERAKEQLEQTDLSVIDIALKCGYTSSSYFHRMFKKSFGVTPTDYRKVKAQ